MSKIKYSFMVIICFIFLMLISCEPISVSVNSKGEIAFSRSEGVFFINLKTKKLVTIDWNYSNSTIPTIVRWSPDGNSLAYTVKDQKSSSNTKVYIIEKDGKNKKELYSISKIITQLEWSKDGKYITLAQAGEDNKLSVADLVLVSLNEDKPKVIIKNLSDVHKWNEDNQLICVKINKKDPKKQIYKANLSIYDVKSQKIESLLPMLISTSVSLDYNSFSKDIVFTAIKVGKESVHIDKNIKASNSNAYIYSLKNKSKSIEKLSLKIINYLNFSSNGKKILIKTKENDYSSVQLGYIDTDTKELKILEDNTIDKVNVSSTSVNVYPTWLDDDNILFWRLNNAYGSNGQALELMSINISTMKKKNHQVAINSAVHKLVEEKGGY